MVYAQGPKGFPYAYCKAQVYPIYLHGPFGILQLYRTDSRPCFSHRFPTIPGPNVWVGVTQSSLMSCSIQNRQKLRILFGDPHRWDYRVLRSGLWFPCVAAKPGLKAATLPQTDMETHIVPC